MLRPAAPRRSVTAPRRSVAGLPARETALRILDAVQRRGETVEQASTVTRGLAGPDRALALAIVGEVLRWATALDAAIDAMTPQPLPEDAKARMVLRMALAQGWRLGTPHHAAIATALPLVSGGPRRLVHGVLGGLFRGEPALPDRPPLPAPVAERWRAAWGQALVAAAEAALALPPPLDLTLVDPAETESWCARLNGISLAPGHVRVPRGCAVDALPGFAEGRWWVQDLAASLPVRLLGAGLGARALDLCAAPGGKTLQLLAAGWQVDAVDMSARRLDRLRANVARVGLPAPEIIVADMLRWAPERRYDAILLDAPCSATGTFRRHPEVLWRSDAGVAALAERQRRMIERAAGWLAPGGRLIYAVCSLEPAEGEAQARAAAGVAGLAPDPILSSELPPGLAVTEPGWVRTSPTNLEAEGGLDGFFIARFRGL